MRKRTPQNTIPPITIVRTIIKIFDKNMRRFIVNLNHPLAVFLSSIISFKGKLVLNYDLNFICRQTAFATLAKSAFTSIFTLYHRITYVFFHSDVLSYFIACYNSLLA